MKLTACFAFTFALSLSTCAWGKSAPDCSRLEASRERVWQQLRRPHSAEQANRLHARVRELNEQIAEHCR